MEPILLEIVEDSVRDPTHGRKVGIFIHQFPICSCEKDAPRHICSPLFELPNVHDECASHICCRGCLRRLRRLWAVGWARGIAPASAAGT